MSADDFLKVVFKPIDAVGISARDYPVGIAIEKIADESSYFVKILVNAAQNPYVGARCVRSIYATLWGYKTRRGIDIQIASGFAQVLQHYALAVDSQREFQSKG